MAPRGKKTTSGRMLGMCYILSMSSHALGGHRGGDSDPCTLRQVQQRCHRGAAAPLFGVQGSVLRKKKLDPIFWWADLPMVLCMGLHMVLGHDGFWPLVFCRSGQGNYGYVLI